MIREGDWKLHHYYEDDGVELYNLSLDPGERVNISHLHPHKTEELLHRLNMWLKEEDALINFEPNPEFDAAFEQIEIAKALRH